MTNPEPTPRRSTDRSRIETVHDWTLQTVKEIIAAREDETDWFDFKADLRYLPKPKEIEAEISRKRQAHKYRIQELACAFANTHGGFIIFGVTNRKEDGDARLVGVDGNNSHSTEFTDLVRAIDPPLNPYDQAMLPLELEPASGRSLWLVEIQESRDGPHMLKGTYYKRMPGQNVPMKAAEVKRRHFEQTKFVQAFAALKHETMLWHTIAAGWSKHDGGRRDRFDVANFKQVLVASAGFLPESLIHELMKMTLYGTQINDRVDAIIKSHADDNMANRLGAKSGGIEMITRGLTLGQIRSDAAEMVPVLERCLTEIRAFSAGQGRYNFDQ